MISSILFFSLFCVAMVLNLAASIWFLVAAFRASILWGLAVLFLPFAGLIFLFTHWEDVRTPFLLNLLAIILFVSSIFIIPNETASRFVSSPSGPAVSEDNEADSESGFSLSRIKTSIQQAAEEREERERTARRGYTGKTLVEVEEELGPPKGIITTSGETHYYYSSLELISIDGQTVADEIHK